MQVVKRGVVPQKYYSEIVKMNQKIVMIFELIFLVLLFAAGVKALGDTIFTGEYEIVYSYHGVEEGDKFSLLVSVKNSGLLKEDVRLEIRDDDPFDVEDDEWDIGTLQSGEEVLRTFRIEVDEDTAEGKYDLEFRIEDKDDDYEDEMEIEVSSDKADLIVGDIASSPATISPDLKDLKLEVTIENIGGGDATFTRARLILPEGFSPSSSFSDIVNLGIIESKGGKTAMFYIDSDKELNSGLSEAKIELEYKTDTEEKVTTLVFELPVKGKPQFEIERSFTSPSRIIAGSTGSLRITIMNTGEEDGEETSVRVFENADFPFNFDEKTSFVGTLKPGEVGTATFDFDIDSDGKANTYLLRMQTRTLTNNDILVEEFTVPITVVMEEKNIFYGPVGYGIVLIGIIAIIYIIYLLLRKPKK